MSSLFNIIRQLRDQVLHPLMRIGRQDFRIDVPHRILSMAEHHSFIGYYDIQPFNQAQSKLLACRCPATHHGRAMDVPLEIGYFDLETTDFQSLGSTDLWCWQMGCRLQWGFWEGKEVVLYNAMKDGEPGTVLYDPETQQEIVSFPVPTYCISDDARYVVSLDFDTLERRRAGYGYDWKDCDENTQNASLILYDTQSKDSKILITTDDVKAINPHPSMVGEGVTHYFNHIHFNPSGSRLLCFHIWNADNKRYVRALTMNIDGSDIRDVTNGRHVSHYWWLGDDALLLYCTDPEHGLGYHVYDQAGGHLRMLDKNIPPLDGHPRAHPNLPYFVSDNVVNKRFERDLWLYHLDIETRRDLASFYSPPRFTGPNRCDLHPRISPKGDIVAVDTAHAGHRQIVVLDIGEIL